MRVVLFGDIFGIQQLIRHVPADFVVAIVCAENRPQYHGEIAQIADQKAVDFFVHPRSDSDRNPEFSERLLSVHADLAICSSYSQLIRGDLLDLFPGGAFNVHYSYLPRNRGCHPIQWAILLGYEWTGVTIHQMTIGFDEGPILDQIQVPILLSDTWLSLREKLNRAADVLLDRSIPTLVGAKRPLLLRQQQPGDWPYGRRRSKADSEVRWTDPVISIFNHVRALLPPCPPAYVTGKSPQNFVEMIPLQWVAYKKWHSLGSNEFVTDRIWVRPFTPIEEARYPVGFEPERKRKSDKEEGLSLEEAIDQTLLSPDEVLLEFVSSTGERLGVVCFREIKLEYKTCEAELGVREGAKFSRVELRQISDFVTSYARLELGSDSCALSLKAY